MACPLCNDTGDQRYWEGRWRDSDAEATRLRKFLEIAVDAYEDEHGAPNREAHWAARARKALGH
jgi:hypothetical protein